MSLCRSQELSVGLLLVEAGMFLCRHEFVGAGQSGLLPVTWSFSWLIKHLLVKRIKFLLSFILFMPRTNAQITWSSNPTINQTHYEYYSIRIDFNLSNRFEPLVLGIIQIDPRNFKKSCPRRGSNSRPRHNFLLCNTVFISTAL